MVLMKKLYVQFVNFADVQNLTRIFLSSFFLARLFLSVRYPAKSDLLHYPRGVTSETLNLASINSLLKVYLLKIVLASSKTFPGSLDFICEDLPLKIIGEIT